MPWSLKRVQEARCLHFVTFSCQHRDALLGTPHARDIFLEILERTRTWYDFYITGYVVMPEHVHLLISEPQRKKLAIVIQMLKQNTAHKLRTVEGVPFWEPRYYDFNVWSEAKRIEKLRYIHRNPVRRGLVERPEDWQWSSFNHYATGIEGPVEIESKWTARKRERAGMVPVIGPRSQNPHPVAQDATRMGTLESCSKEKLHARNSASIILPQSSGGPMRSPLFLVAACLCVTSALGQGAPASAIASSSDQTAVTTIQQLEDEWLKAERTTDPSALERILADDFAGIGANGLSPGKAQLLKNWQPHAGQAPPYTVETSDMHIIVRADTAVAAYTKTYTAKENGNVAHQDMTDVFTRDHGKWKLRISRYTSRDR